MVYVRAKLQKILSLCGWDPRGGGGVESTPSGCEMGSKDLAFLGLMNPHLIDKCVEDDWIADLNDIQERQETFTLNSILLNVIQSLLHKRRKKARTNKIWEYMGDIIMILISFCFSTKKDFKKNHIAVLFHTNVWSIMYISHLCNCH